MEQTKIVRKTISVPEEIYREAKAMAARQGKTINQYVSEALTYLNAIGSGKQPDKL